MKKSFMTRVLAVSLSAAMTFSLSAANMATASAAANVTLSPSAVTMRYGKATARQVLKLKNNTLGWKVKSASVAEKGSKTAGKKVLTVTAKPATNKVVLKVKNIKKSHKVTVTVKVKRTKNKKSYTKLLKCKVTAKPQASSSDDPNTPDTPDTPAVFSTTANATSKTSVDLTFTQPVDQASLVPANFKVDAEGVEVTNVDGGDGRNVRITLSGAEADKQYTLNITGLTVDGNAVDNQTVTFRTPVETAQGYTLKLESNTNQIKADGYAEALITCEVRDPQGELVKDKDYTIRFTSDRGSFSRPDSVTADGVASNVLRSEALDVARDVTITAQIIRIEADQVDDADLIGKQATMTVNMTPVLSNIVVNPIEGAESNQADRLTLHFQNKVDDDTYKTNGVIDKSRISIEVYDDISKLGSLDGGIDFSTENGTVVNLVPVAGDDKALQVLVDKPLTDNRYVGVKVKMTDPNSQKTSTYEESFMLTDSTTPRVLKVEPVNRRQIKVTYSEAVLPEELATKVGIIASTTEPYADNLSNYIIGGKALIDSQWGEGDKKAKITVGSGLDNQDGREVVTVTLGEDKYFDADKYTLTVHNIGDWAACTDGRNNIVTTDSKDFTISNDDTKPDIESIDVQSPEQILVTFNKPVKKDKDFTVSGKTLALPVKRAASDGTAENDDDDGKTESIIQLRDNGTDVSGINGDNPIRVTQVDSVGRQFLIETTKDWSTVYGQRGSYNDDYFNHKYSLYIPANSLVNTDNGEKNTGDITRDLSDNAVLSNPDNVGPVIDSNITWNGSEAYVKFNEPVKVRNIGQTRGLNDEGTTVSVKQQTESNDKNVQQATAEFICPGKDTVAGEFVRFTDSTDKEVVVKPANDEILSNGTWTLRISGVSDDFGNTSSGGGNVEVNGAETDFKVAWASVAIEDKYEPIRTSEWNASGADNQANADTNVYIYVKFTNAVSTRSGAVYDLKNYTINSNNGSEIRDAYIKAGINGYDHNSGITDSITIVIPQRSAYVVTDNPQNTTLAISNQVVSANGLVLAENQEYRLPYNSNVVVADSNINAVFGDYDAKDNTAEQFDGNSSLDTDSEYKAAVEAAIRSDKYRKIILTRDITDLNISRPVDIDLNGHGLYGTTRVSFTDGATCNIYNTGSTSPVVIKKLDINTPNADWNIDNNKAVGHNGTVNVGGSNTGKIQVNELVLRAIASKTLTNTATIDLITVNSGSSSVKIVNKDSGVITKIVLDNVNKSGTVKIQNKGDEDNIGTITVKNPVKIDTTKDSSTDAPLATIKEIVVEASRDVELKAEDNVIKKLTGNTSAVTVKKGNEEIAASSLDGITVENTNAENIKKIVDDALLGTVEITSSSSVKTDNIAKDISKAIESQNNGEISYDIFAETKDNPEIVILDADGADPTKFTGNINLISSPSNDDKITIYFKVGEQKVTVKTITVKIK